MKYPVLTTLITTLLVGCSSGNSTQDAEQIKAMTGGQSVGETSSLYWYTEINQKPDSASDYVTSGNYGWYQSDYQWRDENLKEVIREGEILKDEELVSYKAHLRFNDNQEAVYQRYTLDGRVLPMRPEQIAHIQREAEALTTIVSEQDRNGERLYQGYWDGDSFTTCSGREYEELEFNKTLPTFVINRLANLDSYAAFIGKPGLGSKLTIIDIFLLHDEDFDCIEPVDWIDD